MNELEYSNAEFEAEIKRTDDGAILIWGDYVANQWEEKFDNLSAAVARLALLIHCSDPSIRTMFSLDNGTFNREWNTIVKDYTF